MCGISGIVSGGDQQANISAMCRALEHRGPENSTFYHSGNFWLGHNRLRIIDIETGDQPIFNEDHSLAIVFNGEIYNYQSLREDLIKRGHTFYTSSDTEVLVHLYEDYGEKMFARLNGIFAFALLDARSQKLILGRDHFGVKPMHYFYDGQHFIFGSEIKAILNHSAVPRRLNRQSLHLQVNLRYTQSENTLFDGVRRLPPGSYLTYQGGVIKLERYYQLQPGTVRISTGDAIDGIHHYLRQAVRRQLVSDVPIGVYLSGGLDSSSIVAMMAEIGVTDIRTFTLGFNEPTDEFSDSQLIADQFATTHQTLSLNLEPLRTLPQVIWHAEEPKINLLQGFALSDFVSQHVKVVLGGLGGDELFAGYDVHRLLAPFDLPERLVPASLERYIGRLLSRIVYGLQQGSGTLKYDEIRRGLQVALASGNVLKQLLILRNVWDYDRPQARKIYSQDFLECGFDCCESEFRPYFPESGKLATLDKILFTEFHTKMVNDYLLVEDRMSMAHSIEERVPFLDRELVEFAFSIPSQLKLRRRETKALFRQAMAPYLPEKIIHKKKWGFAVNPYLQYQKDLKQVAERILTRSFIEEQGIFNYSYIRQILDYPPHPNLRWHYNFLWILLGQAIWEKMYIGSDLFRENNQPDIEAFYN
ncbi:MAG: asparagine synthase (glutamine-hydrolyzing) [Candidatus Neomarinimicrobiota bacterium]